MSDIVINNTFDNLYCADVYYKAAIKNMVVTDDLPFNLFGIDVLIDGISRQNSTNGWWIKAPNIHESRNYGSFIKSSEIVNTYNLNLQINNCDFVIYNSNIKDYLFVNELLFKIEEMQERESISKTLSYLFSTLEKKLLANKFDFCDKFLAAIDVDRFNTTVLIGILTITYPWESKLNNRQDFFIKVKSFVYKTYTVAEAEEILIGIE